MDTGARLRDHLALRLSMSVCACMRARVCRGNTTGGPSSVDWQL